MGRQSSAALSLIVLACVEEPSATDAVDETETGVAEGTASTMHANSSTTADPTMGAGTSTASDQTTSEPTTTGTVGCDGNEDCPAVHSPFCVDGACVSCSQTPHPGNACAGLDPTTPLCVRDSCVQCTSDSVAACGGGTPICDANTNTCIACSFHEQCEALGLPACHIAEGSCFDAIAVTEVSTDVPDSIQQAIDAVADGERHAIVITGQQSSGHHININGGKIVALVSSSEAIRDVRSGNDGAPIVRVAGAGTVAYLHRVRLYGNGNDVGIAAFSGATLYGDRSHVVQNTGGGITLGSSTTAFLRNCFVGHDANDYVALAINGADASVVYSTLYSGFAAAAALDCTSPGIVDVRNSILVIRDRTADPTSCSGAGVSIESSAEQNAISTSLFVGYGTGDVHLTAAGDAEFAGVAAWEDGDPPFDIDGDDPRPSMDGDPDYAGADVP